MTGRTIQFAWIVYLMVGIKVTSVGSELCTSRRSNYVLTTIYEQDVTREACMWGCCHDNSPPCCPVPTSLVVGTILGGVLIGAIVTAWMCYHCVYRRNEPCLRLLRRLRYRRPAPSEQTNQSNVTYHSESIEDAVLETQVVRYNDAPPSYEEVMKGQINQAFKPDTRDGDGQ